MLQLLLFALSLLPQDHHAMNQRGEMVMGFDQDKTAHHSTSTRMAARSTSR